MSNLLFDALFAPLAGRTSPLLILRDGSEIGGDTFLRLVSRQAHALRGAGVRPGDRVAAQVAKTPEALALYAATIGLGAVFLPLNTAYTASELDYFIGNATPRIVLCDPAREAVLAPVCAAYGAGLLTLGADGGGTLSERAAQAHDRFDAVPRAGGDIAAILYTSGTTGRSKGAMLTHRNLLSNAEALVGLWRFTDRDVLMQALPIFHTHGLFVASNVSLLSGGAMIFLPGFDAVEVVRLLPRATAMMGVPTFYTRLMADPRFGRDLTEHVRVFISGSAPLLAETHREFERRTGHAILERYGMTETSMNTSNPYEGARRAGTVGFPLPGLEVRLTSGGVPVPPGEVGMIEVRGPNVFAGYWQMPDKTAEDLRPDGFFITGDLGHLDEEGYLQIVGRSKDLVISGGYNVYPREIELLLDAVPGVAESAVIGLPHPDFGEAVFAVLAATPGVPPDPAQVLAAIAGRLARYKQPKAAVVVESLPRNTMGKVQKALLRQTYAGWFDGQDRGPAPEPPGYL